MELSDAMNAHIVLIENEEDLLAYGFEASVLAGVGCG